MYLAVLGLEHTTEFAISLITILVYPVITLIGETNRYDKFEGIIYLSFEVCKSVISNALDIVVELMSLIYDILRLSLNTTFQFFTNHTFDYRDFKVSYALDSESLNKGVGYSKETNDDQNAPLLLNSSSEEKAKIP